MCLHSPNAALSPNLVTKAKVRGHITKVILTRSECAGNSEVGAAESRVKLGLLILVESIGCVSWVTSLGTLWLAAVNKVL